MSTLRATASISLCPSGPRTAPGKVRIWKSGSNPGDYGDLFVTPQSVARVVQDYLKRGVSKLIDIEHNTNPAVNKVDPNDPPITGGYFDIEVQGPESAPEVWIVPRWSDCGRDAPVAGKVCCAKHQIESGQREYISPDWDLDSETREPIRLNRVSLVGEPGTYGISMLASAGVNRKASRNMDEMAKLRAAYAGAMALAASSDEKIKASAVALCESLMAAASALGVDLDKAEEAPAGTPEALAAAEADKAKVVAPPAMGASPATMPAVAAEDKPTVEKPLTAGALHVILAERDERTAMMADPRLDPAMKNVVASADLKTARAIIRALPAKAAPQGSEGPAGPVNHIAGSNQAGPMNMVEQHQAERNRQMLGVSVENVTAARKLMESDPDGEGGVTVSFKALVDKHKALRNPGLAGMRFGV